MSVLTPHRDPAPPTPPPTPASTRPVGSPLARWCARHRWVVLALALVALLGGGAAASRGIVTTPPEAQLVGDSRAAVDIQMASDLGGAPVEHVVVTARDGSMSVAERTALGRELTAAYEGVDGVASVGDPVPGADGASVVLPVELDAVSSSGGAEAEGPSASEVVGPVLAVTDDVRAAHPDLEVGQVGEGSASLALDESMGEDFARAELFSIPLTLIILAIAFGAVVAAGVPLVLGLLSVVTAMGITAALSRGAVDVDPNAQSLVLLIGLAVGVDYALFVLRRAHEERAAGASVEDAIAVAGATAGRAVVISGVTVVVAMAGMLVAGGLFSSLAVGTIVVVALAVVFSATVLPALLAVLGDRVDALRLPFARRREARRAAGRSVWGRVAGVATRRPLAWAAVVTALLVALAAPALGMKTALGGVETLPQDLPVVAATHQLERAIPSDGTAVQVVVRAPAGSEAEVARALETSSGDLAALPHVSGVAPQPQVSGDGTVSVLDVGVGMSASDERLPGVVAQVRDEADDIRAELADVPGAQVHVGGQAASTDLTQWMDSRLPWVVGFVLALTFVVMALSFGSLWLAAATIGLNLLSVGAAYGVMTAIFSGTWAESVLDFDSTGAIAAWLPLLMFVVLFGLSMDYHVFVASRVREARLAGSSPREAVRLGVARSAGVVTSAAAVMIGVFSIFATLSVLDMKQLGVGLAVAILLDATVVRALLLPAVLALLGDRAHRGPRWLPVFHH